ncbi:MAG: DUF4347 domain-containing protein [Aquabacterium sp.]
MAKSGLPSPKRPIVEALEAKLLYSADLGVTAFAPTADASLNQTLMSDEASMAVLDCHASLIEQGSATEIAFIDASVTDVAGLVQDIQQQAAQGRPIEVVVIRSDEDGLARITQTLLNRQDITAVHLIGHGHEAGMQLGTSELDADSLLQHAGDIAQWGNALSADGDLLLYGCEVGLGTPGQALVDGLASLTGADVAASNDLTGSSLLGGDWDLEVQTGQIDAPIAIGAAMQSQWQALLLQATPSSKGTAVWAVNGDATAQQRAWDGLTLSQQTNTATLSTWKVITSAQSPTRNEAMAVGVDASGTIRAQRWDGMQWSAIPLNPLATSTVADRQGFAVAYEHNSGDAVLVWNNGSSLRYSTFNGTTWSAAAAIGAYTGGAPQQMQLVSSPTGDGMVLALTDANGDDYAMVWNGSSWGNAVSLDTSGTGSADQLSLGVAYESLSGHAMVAYAKAGNANVYYRMFNGSSWSSEAAVGSFSETAAPQWLTLASDPTSDRIALGFLSTGAGNAAQVSLAVWGGSSWGTRLVANSYTDATPGTDLSLAFESRSGDLLAVYGGGDNALRYRTWTNAGGWSSQSTGPTTGAAGAVRLYADPLTNHVMMGVQAESGAVSFTDWDGSAFGGTSTMTANSGSTLTPAFTWLWQNDDSGNTTNTLLVGSASDTTGWRGVNNVSDTEVMAFDDPAASYGSGTTYGSFSHVVNLEALGAQGVDDIVMVNSSVALASGVTVQRGDLLFTTSGTSTLLNADGSTLAVNNDDVVRFRPTVAGRYDQGTFTILVQSLGSTRVGLSAIVVRGPDVRGLALVEQATTVAGTSLAAGTLLFTSGTGTAAANIQYITLSSANLLSGLLVGSNASTLITGSNVNINQAITGLEVISAATPLKNVTLNAGSLLFTLEADDSSVGNTGTAIAVNRGDVAVLSPSNATQATATTLLQGNSVGLTAQALDSLALSLDAAPAITSNGGGTTAAISVAEGQTAVTTVTATDADSDRLTYRISGGTDARRFSIDASTGVLTFSAAMDFEDPVSAANSNAYQVIVSVGDGTYTDTQTITVTVTNVNEAPVIEAPPGMSSIFGYNYMDIPVANSNGTTSLFTIRASDPDGQTLTYSLEGLSANYFTVSSSTGLVKLKQFQAQDGDNYLLTLVATDPSGAKASLSLVLNASASISTANDYRPAISGNASQTVNVVEESTFVMDVDASDSDFDANITYSIVSGYGNASLFQINAITGALSFKDAPIYSSSGTNTYSVRVSASDGTYSDTLDLTVNVLDHNDPPTNTLPPSFSTNEDAAVNLAGISIADSDAASGTMAVTFSVAHGTLNASTSVTNGVTSVSGNNSRQVTLTGTLAAINNTLAATGGLRYQADANFAGSDTLTMLSNDQGNSGQAYAPAVTTDTDTAIIIVAPLSDLTVAAASSGTLNYTENAAATPVDPGLTLNDVDGASITGASVRITGGYVSSEDVLSFVNQAGISGSWDAGSGTLTLTGSGTIADWQAALRAVSYRNSSDTPNTAARTVTFSVTDAGSTITTTRGIAITAVNDLPVLTGSGTTLAYTENGAPVALDASLTITDVDSTSFSSASIQITGNYAQGQDVLAFTNQSGITGSWNAANGMLTLSGAASLSAYQAALRTITYANTSDNPSTATRGVSINLHEGNGSGTLTRAISVAAVNDAPVLSTSPTPQAYSTGDGATAIDPALALTDADNTQIQSATVRITGNYANGEDNLLFTNQSGITGSWNSFTGTLTLSGAATVADYQAALRSVQYNNTPFGLPSYAMRTVTFQVNDGSTTATATRQIDILMNNDAPTLTVTGTPLNYAENATVIVDSALTVTDPDTTGPSQATVSLGSTYVAGQDVLAYTGPSSITSTWDATTGTLTLVGAGSVADLEAALRSVTYTNTSDNPSTAGRTLRFSIIDGNITVSADRSLYILASNDGPTLATSPSSLNYEEGPSQPIDPELTFSDPDTAVITGATISFTGTYIEGEDELTFTTQGGITGQWDALNGVLTLSGNASPQDYEAALRSVGYRNLSDTPDTRQRNVTFSIGDGSITVTAMQHITIAAIDDTPVIGISTPTLPYTEGAGAVSIDPALTLTDPDSANLIGAVIQIDGNYLPDQDELVFVDQGGIYGTWDADNGTLVLNGLASVADYQAALRSVTYRNNSAAPDTSTRSLLISVDDGSSTGTASLAIAVTATNDLPQLAVSTDPSAYTEGNAAIAVAPELTLGDVDSLSYNGATVRIGTHYLQGEDTLQFTNQLGITGSWDAGSGTLTLSGTASVADYQTALRSVAYVNSSDTPSTLDRTVSFSIDEGAGAATADKTVTVTAVANMPVITTTGTALSYTENDAATVVDAGVTLVDPDTSSYTGASAQITSGYVAGEDWLSFTPQAGITASWDADTGTLALMGNASVADYQAALRSITYRNSSEAPDTGSRRVTFSFSDGVSTASAWRDVTVTAVNDTPVLSTSSGTSTFTENDDAIAIDPALTLTDVDDSPLSAVTLVIGQGYASGQDVLGFVDTAGITGQWNAGTGTLTLTGAGSMSDYQAALRSVTFVNTSEAPTAGLRRITITLDDGSGPVSSECRIDVVAVNDAPTLQASGGSASYTENAYPIVIDAALSLSDVDSATLQGATVRITGPYVSGQDLLAFTNQSGITGSWDADTGILTLSGTSSVANYQTALRSITYLDTSDNPATHSRTITWTVQDGAHQVSTSRDITLTAVDDETQLTLSPSVLNYAENAGAIAVDPGLTLSDADTATLQGATVRIDGTYVAAQDRLDLPAQAGISASWDATTGTLTLSGQAGIASYQAALRSITYTNSSEAPSTAPRQIVFTVEGGYGPLFASRSLAVSAVNDAPVITANSLNVTAGGRATPVIAVADVDTALANITLSVQSVSGGRFVNAGTQATVTQFSYTDVQAGQIVFQHDGSDTAPTYILVASDGQASSAGSSAAIGFVPNAVVTPTTPTGSNTSDSASDSAADSGKPTEAAQEDTPKAAEVLDSAPLSTGEQALMAAAPGAGLEALRIGSLERDRYDAVAQARILAEAQAAETTKPQAIAGTLEFESFRLNWSGDLQTLINPEELRRNLDALHEQLLEQGAERRNVVASSIAVTTGLSVGYVIWLLRGGALLGSMLSAMPAWQMIDPLPVLTRGRAQNGAAAGGEDDQPIEHLFDDQPDGPLPEPPPPPPSPVAPEVRP